jgi:protein-disulfide isomerase
MPNDPNLTKAQRREAARADALKLRKQQEARDRRNRLITIGALVVLVIAVVVAVVWINDANKPKPLGDVTMPSTAQSDGGISIGKDGTAGTDSGEDAVKLDLYLDYMCPNCGEFEKVNQSDIDGLRKAGDITLVLHPVNILDSESQGTKYSTRAANAFGTVADKAPTKVVQFNAALFANQPQENSTGLTDAKIAQVATGAGVPQDVADSFTKGTFNAWVDAVTNHVGNDKDFANPSSGGFGTPTILINGKYWNGNWTQAGALKSAIQAAEKK